MLHILNATIPSGEEPKVKMKGRKGSRYILAIDPNSSAGSDEADNFAISVIELVDDDPDFRGVLVHSYATPNSEVKSRVKYMNYLMKNFNVVFIIMDNAGGPRFLEEYNALVENEHEHIYLANIDFTDDDTFRMTSGEYSPVERKIAFSQVFNKKNWIREANEIMQADLQRRHIMFASSIQNSDADLTRSVGEVTPFGDLDFMNMSDDIIGDARRWEHVIHVDDLVSRTAKELGLIQIKTDAVGNYTFDLPTQLKNKGGKDRARRDSYTSLLLGNYARHYYKRLVTDDGDGDVYAGFFLGR